MATIVFRPNQELRDFGPKKSDFPGLDDWKFVEMEAQAMVENELGFGTHGFHKHPDGEMTRKYCPNAKNPYHGCNEWCWKTYVEPHYAELKRQECEARMGKHGKSVLIPDDRRGYFWIHDDQHGWHSTTNGVLSEYRWQCSTCKLPMDRGHTIREVSCAECGPGGFRHHETSNDPVKSKMEAVDKVQKRLLELQAEAVERQAELLELTAGSAPATAHATAHVAHLHRHPPGGDAGRAGKIVFRPIVEDDDSVGGGSAYDDDDVVAVIDDDESDDVYEYYSDYESDDDDDDDDDDASEADRAVRRSPASHDLFDNDDAPPPPPPESSESVDGAVPLFSLGEAEPDVVEEKA